MTVKEAALKMYEEYLTRENYPKGWWHYIQCIAVGGDTIKVMFRQKLPRGKEFVKEYEGFKVETMYVGEVYLC
jgi:hypothetical protein